MNETPSYHFGEFLVEPSQNQLSVQGDVRTLKPKTMDVLVYLIQNRDRVISAAELLDKLWPGRVVEESTIHRCINQLRNALGDSSTQSRYVKTVLKRGYQAVAEVAIYEGSKTNQETIAKASSFKQRSLTILGAAAMSLILLAGIAYFLPQDGRESFENSLNPSPSIAVLPFVAMSSGEEDSYFADGLTEEILNSLAQLTGLKVAARTSSFYFKDKDTELSEIGDALGVAHLLEGSIRRSDDRIRVTAQLVEAEGGFHLWSETYDRNLVDIFSIQDDIAAQVTDALRIELLGDDSVVLAQHGTDSAEAQSLYLIARARYREMSRIDYDLQANPAPGGRMRVLFEEATRLDPDYVDAWAGLAEAILLLGRDRQDDRSGVLLRSRAAREQAKTALDKAKSLAPNAISTLLASALLNYRQYDTVASQRNEENLTSIFAGYEKILEIDPGNEFALEELARIHERLGNYAISQELYRKVLELDPLSPVTIDLARSYFYTDPTEAYRRMRLAGDLFPDSNWRWEMGLLEAIRGHFHHAELWYSSTTDSKGFLGGLIHDVVSMSLGNDQQAYERIASVKTNAGAGVANIAGLTDLIYRGEYETVATRLLRAIDRGYKSRIFTHLIPALIRLGRFEEAVEQADASFQRGPGTTPEAHFETAHIGDPRIYYEIAHALQVIGATSRAQVLRDQLREQIHSKFDMNNEIDRRLYLEGELLLLASEGRIDEALDAFENLVDSGWRWLVAPSVNAIGGEKLSLSLFRFEDNPILDSLRSEKRFIEKLNFVNQENARMQAELEAGLSLEDIIEDY